MANKYEVVAAKSVLSTFLESTDPTPSQIRIAAACELLDGLEAVLKELELSPERPKETSLRALIGGTDIFVLVQTDGTIAVRRGGDRPSQVPLAYDRVEKRFEGTEEDEDWTPVPGGPRRRRRGALVVAAETIVAVARGEG